MHSSALSRKTPIRILAFAVLFCLAGHGARADSDYVLGRGFDIGPLNFAGYADLNLQAPKHQTTSLVLNDLSVFVSGHFGRFFNPFTEAELARINLLDRQSPQTREGGGDVALERLYNDAFLTDSLTVRIGKMLSPVGEWNVIHASPLVLSDIRPAVTYRDFSEYTTGASLIYADAAGIFPEIQIYAQPAGELTERPHRLTFHQYRDVEGVHASVAFGLLDRLGVSFQHSRDTAGVEQFLSGADYHYTTGRVTLQGEATVSSLSGPLSQNSRSQLSQSAGRSSEWGAYAAISYAVDESWSIYGWYEAFTDRASPQRAQDLLFGIAYHFHPALVGRVEYAQNIGGQPVNQTGLFASWSVLF